ncbi:START domain [Trypanosoma melophagium]|uniref:START domain n=1 Tax=Trypanosoma melophagium TaxID=715481 RepID=UPI00351A6394|nr:START domain [Trypanosoma melophagium]
MSSHNNGVIGSDAGKSREDTVVAYQTPFPITGPEVQHGGRTYRLATKQDCLSFRNFADSLDDFKLHYSRENEVITWSKRIVGEPMHIIKVFGVFPDVQPLTLYDMLQDAVFREVWDKYRIDAFRIVKLDENNDIGYYAAKSPIPGVANRDFVNQRAWINAGNDEYVIFNTSVPHREVPLDYLKAKKISSGSVVRGISKITGYLVRPWSDEKGTEGSCLTYITQCDPAGWIPSAVTNFISTNFAPNTIKSVREAAKQFKEWLPKQKDYVKDWPETADPYDVPVEHLTIEFAKEKWGPGGDSGKRKKVKKSKG